MKKEFAIDRWIHGLTMKQWMKFGTALILLISVYIRYALAPNLDLSADYHTFYEAWIWQYRGMSLREALGTTVGDYYVPLNLMYILASRLPFPEWGTLVVITCATEYIGAYFLYKILCELTEASEEKRLQIALLVSACLLLPFTYWNSALWKQAEAIYTCFLLIAGYFLIKKKYTAMMIFFAIGFSVKMQVIFVLPFLIALYLIEKRFSILQFFWIPVIFLLAGLPSVLCKRGLRATYFTYFMQTQEGVTEDYGMNSFFPNLYAFGLDDYNELLNGGAVCITVAILGLEILLFMKYAKNLNAQKWLGICIWMAWTCVIFLPGMHERYDYVSLILLCAYALVIRRKMLIPALMAVFCSFQTYTMVLFSRELALDLRIVAIIYIVAFVWYSYDIVGRIREKSST